MQFDRRSTLMGLAAAPVAAQFDLSSKITVFEAKKIVTMDRSLPHSRFMAVANGIILGLAANKEALSPWIEGRSVTLDRRFADKVLFPGLVDPHIHPMQAAVMLGMPFLAPDEWHLPSGRWPALAGREAWLGALRQIVDNNSGKPLIVWGHHELFHGHLGKAELDKLAPDQPVFVWQRSFHEIITNSAGLDHLGVGSETAFANAITAAKADPAQSSFASGIFSETGLAIPVGKLQPILLDPQRMASGFAGLQQMMARRGVTTTCDLATGIFANFDVEAGLISRAFNSDTARARLSLMPIAGRIDDQGDIAGWLKQAQRFAGPNVSIGKRVKLFSDGAFFAQNMMIGPPGYSDGHIGKWLTEPEALAQLISYFWEAGFALHIHVNGDQGLDAVLDGIGQLPARPAQTITLEHLGYAKTAQIEKLARMGVMVSAQPNYIRVLGEAYARKGLGPDRAAVMNRLGSLERRNVPLGLHSDFNMAPIDPFYLAWIAETREGIDGVVRAPDERLSREKALRAITLEAAQVIGQDAQVGSLTAGKRADFIALDDDPLEVETAAMKELPIAATVFEGRV